jgi:hypothetical protein
MSPFRSKPPSSPTAVGDRDAQMITCTVPASTDQAAPET